MDTEEREISYVDEAGINRRAIYVPHYKFTEVNFSLNAQQLEKLNRWLEETNLTAAYQQLKDAKWEKARKISKRLPYHGPIGGGLTFRFIQTSLGEICKVKESITGSEIDLSDYEGF